MKGKKHSDETKEKMRLASIGNKAFLGKKHSEETKEKLRKPRPNRQGISPWSKGKKLEYLVERNKSDENPFKRKGEAHHSWKGGITPERIKIRESKEGRAWKKAVLERDGHKCTWCDSTKKLNVDHIKPFAYFPESRTDVDNGRTLCFDCHNKSRFFCRECGISIR